MKEFMLACVLLPALIVRALAGSTIKAILFGCGAIIVVNIPVGYLFFSLVGHEELFLRGLAFQTFAFVGGFCAWTMIFLGKGVLFCLIELLVFLVAALITGKFLYWNSCLFYVITSSFSSKRRYEIFYSKPSLEKKQSRKSEICISPNS